MGPPRRLHQYGSGHLGRLRHRVVLYDLRFLSNFGRNGLLPYSGRSDSGFDGCEGVFADGGGSEARLDGSGFQTTAKQATGDRRRRDSRDLDEGGYSDIFVESTSSRSASDIW